MRSFTRRRLIITVIVFCWMSLLSLAVTIMLGSAHFADVDVVLWTIEDGPAHMARIRLVTTDAPLDRFKWTWHLLCADQRGIGQLTHGVSLSHESQSSPAKRTTFLAVVSMA